MSGKILSCDEVRRIDLVDYLQSLGHHPQKIRNNDYWYLSPLRNEQEPSFKVNRKLNAWFDYGIGKGGNMIDFGILYHNCSVKKLLEKLQNDFSFHRQIATAQTLNNADEKKVIKVLSENPITNPALCTYLQQRNIPVELANQYCRQVQYALYEKTFYAIGFQNNAGGFELRNPYFKGSSAPKDITFIDRGAGHITVMEGFFSFLSYHVMHPGNEQPLTNFLVLNSLSFLEKSRSLMEKHELINLYLDRDEAGMKYTKKALAWNQKYRDESYRYENYKDLNACLVGKHAGLRQSRKLKMRF